MSGVNPDRAARSIGQGIAADGWAWSVCAGFNIDASLIALSWADAGSGVLAFAVAAAGSP